MPDYRSGVVAPDLSLRCHAKFVSDPFGFELLSSVAISGRSGEDQRSSPVARPFLQRFQSVSEPPLPFWIHSIRIVAPRPSTDQKACLNDPPDLRSLPADRIFLNFLCLRIIVPGPLHPVRFAVPLTSWNHLHNALKPICSQ